MLSEEAGHGCPAGGANRRRWSILSYKRREGPEPLPSLVDSRDLAHQDELYHPVINNRPAILVSVDK